MDWRERQTLDKFRRRQILRASQVDSLIRREWATLDISDIDRGRERVLDGIESRIIGLRTLEAREADAFVSRMRELARVGSGSIVLAPANPGAGLRESLEISGPVSFKQRVGAGALDEVAFLAARDQMMAEARKLIMDAGRETVRLSAEANRRSIGWRRVSDGNPCAFCAMLVGRGPAYKSEGTALGLMKKYHKHCGCTAVEVFTDWEPTEREQKYVDAYQAAAEYADEKGVRRGWETILPHMRANGNFKDSPKR